ncbi:MAG: methyltransferase domain-containing protein [Campylobacterota bacterium]|nr:methyltransferase domain-containing protein [Campylobacterota bacterium]
MELDLYAKVEHLLDIEDSTEDLHQIYIDILQNYDVTKLLDIGCGRGLLMQKLSHLTCKGIDLSALMVEQAQAKGLDVTCKDVSEVDERFDLALAVFDVLNFLDTTALDNFMASVASLLDENGIFMADINTLHGFANVAEGVMVAEDENFFLSVNAIFDSPSLSTELTLFERHDNDLFTKEQDIITQYFHPLSFFKKQKHLKLIEKRNISLYDEDDKTLLIFKKVTS